MSLIFPLWGQIQREERVTTFQPFPTTIACLIMYKVIYSPHNTTCYFKITTICAFSGSSATVERGTKVLAVSTSVTWFLVKDSESTKNSVSLCTCHPGLAQSRGSNIQSSLRRPGLYLPPLEQVLKGRKGGRRPAQNYLDTIESSTARLALQNQRASLGLLAIRSQADPFKSSAEADCTTASLCSEQIHG